MGTKPEHAQTTLIRASLPTSGKARTHKPSTRAAGIFAKLNELDLAEQAELANAPQSIRARYVEKRAKLYEGIDGEVLDLVKRFRGPEAAEFREEGPASE